MRSIACGILVMVAAAACVGCGSGAPRPDPPDRAILPTLVIPPVTCETAFDGFRADDEWLRDQAEFDSLAACETRARWIETGASALAEQEHSLIARLIGLCGEPRHAETPVCRDEP
ncbi:hypothetical protein [Myceligenerans pegani]|uniref:Secreted protein n=1 Tax=Myceligenerans pegani TaxID=2776917 RepID=A0ABR9N501_9MICO|nr:hypothetical protein [Myceligenerans sp. TRM 65318]MBE1878351.1 hypothetical protein [Myceligenerans sp. TRM 65318]MBE3020622.1 hypothetical protein [Myceligenerans sp. TRM 65318]